MLIDFEEIKHKLNNSKWYGTQAWYEILDIIGDCDDKSRPKGEWLDSGSGWKCSNCGFQNEWTMHLKHCPDCCADMRGKE